MSCALTSGYTLDCRDSMGGVIEMYFIAFNDVSAITEASGIVTAITKSAPKRFYKYEQERETASFVENLTSSIQNGSNFFTQELTTVINKMAVATRNELSLLVKNRLMAVVKDANGLYWLLGRTRGLQGTAGNSGTGVAGADRNGYTFTFTATEPALAVSVDSATVSTLQTPGV